jgi:phosphoadenosine phosphosulfate reductase
VNIDIPAESLLDGDKLALARTNHVLESMTAQERVCWAMQKLPAQQVVSSSFGIQSAVMLHLLTSIKADIPVILQA